MLLCLYPPVIFSQTVRFFGEGPFLFCFYTAPRHIWTLFYDRSLPSATTTANNREKRSGNFTLGVTRKQRSYLQCALEFSLYQKKEGIVLQRDKFKCLHDTVQASIFQTCCLCPFSAVSSLQPGRYGMLFRLNVSRTASVSPQASYFGEGAMKAL